MNMKVYLMMSADNYSDSNYTVMGDTRALVADPTAPHRMLHTPSYVVLIDHPTAGWIMYDTGTADDYLDTYPDHIREAMRTEKPDAYRMERQLALVGVRPEQIQHVILSHMHMDHIGNNKLFAQTADFYVAKEEAGHAFRMVMNSQQPEDHGWYIKEEVLQPLKRLTYIDRDEVLFPGVEVVLLPGHTPGVMGLVLHLDGGTLIFTSDAANVQANYEGNAPGGVMDSVGFLESVRKIHSLQRQYDAQVFFSHDTDQVKQLKFAPAYYE